MIVIVIVMEEMGHVHKGSCSFIFSVPSVVHNVSGAWTVALVLGSNVVDGWMTVLS